MKKFFGVLALGAAALALVGCSGNDFGNGPRIAFANALRQDLSITGKVDGQNKTGLLAPGQTSTDNQFDNGYRKITILDPNGTTLAERNDYLFEEKNNYLAIAFNSQTGGGAADSVDLTIAKENEVTTTGKANVHLARATNRFGDVDIYFVPAGGDVATSQKFTLLNNGEDNTTKTFEPGTYDVRVFAKDTVSPRLNGPAEFTLDGSKNYLFIYTAEGEIDTATPKFIQYLER